MTPMARNICTRTVFTFSSFNFGLQTYFVTEGHYMLCSRKEFIFKKEEQSCLKWCGKLHVKGHTYVGVYRVDTMFLFC